MSARRPAAALGSNVNAVRSARKPDGEAALSFVAVCVVAGLLVGGLLAAAPGWAGGLGAKVESVVCSVTGTRCEPEAPRRAQDGPRPEAAPSTITGSGLTATTFGATTTVASPVIVHGGDPTRCATIIDDEDGARAEQICLATTGPAVGYCRQGAFDASSICKAAEVPLAGPNTRCADDPETPDPAPGSATPRMLLCQIVFDDTAAGSALVHCTPSAANARLGTCENTHAVPALFPAGGPMPPNCFGMSERSPLQQEPDGLLSTTWLTLCSSSTGALAVCTITAAYAEASVRGRIDGIDDLTGLIGVPAARIRADCSQSLVAGVEKRLGMDCSDDSDATNTATCTIVDRLRCAVFRDRDDRPTYHHCQDLERLPAAGACEPGNVTDENCAVEPEVPGGPDFGESCDFPTEPTGPTRGLQDLRSRITTLAINVRRFAGLCLARTPTPAAGMPVARPIGLDADADGNLLGPELVTADQATEPLKGALLHEEAALQTMRCGFAVDGIDGRGAAPKVLASEPFITGLTRTQEIGGFAIGRVKVILINPARPEGMSSLAHETVHMMSLGLGVRGTTGPQLHLQEVLAEMGSHLIGSQMAAAAKGRDQLVAYDLKDGAIGMYRHVTGQGGNMNYKANRAGVEAVVMHRFIAGGLVLGLGPLVATQPTWLPPGCEGSLAESGAQELALARWFGESVRELGRSGGWQPTLETLCKAMVTTGSRRKVDPLAIAAVFARYDIRCGRTVGRDPAEL